MKTFFSPGMLMGLLGMLLFAAPLQAQGPSKVPFFAGEAFAYRVQVSRVGTVGQGIMRMDEASSVQGREVLRLSFDFNARFGVMRASNQSESLFDPKGMTSLGFSKKENHPLSKHEEQVSIFPAEKRWEAADGRSGQTLSSQPLDELSFLYYLRTLPLENGDVYPLDRHFDASRNPVQVKVMGRERVKVGAGTFDAIKVEMKVQDSRYQGSGTIRIFFSDDEYRLPVRIESALPVVGKAVFTLEEHNHPVAHLARK